MNGTTTQNNRERSSKSPSSKKAKATHDHFEFGGVPGAMVLPLVLVGTILLLFFGANDSCVLSITTILDGSIVGCLKDQLANYSFVELVLPSSVRSVSI